MGHKDSKTTEIYAHVAMRELSKIKSPVDLTWASSKRDEQRGLHILAQQDVGRNIAIFFSVEHR